MVETVKMSITGGTVWKLVRGAWAVAINLVVFVVITAVLQAGVAHGQGLTVTVLVLTYLLVAVNYEMQMRWFVDQSVRSSRQFVALSRFMNDVERQPHLDSLKEYQEAFRSSEPRFIIDCVFHTLAWMVALWYLFSEL